MRDRDSPATKRKASESPKESSTSSSESTPKELTPEALTPENISPGIITPESNSPPSEASPLHQANFFMPISEKVISEKVSAISEEVDFIEGVEGIEGDNFTKDIPLEGSFSDKESIDSQGNGKKSIEEDIDGRARSTSDPVVTTSQLSSTSVESIRLTVSTGSIPNKDTYFQDNLEHFKKQGFTPIFWQEISEDNINIFKTGIP